MFIIKASNAEEAQNVIFADPTEKQFIEKIKGSSVVYAPGLEEETGADIMITPLALPYAPKFLDDHLKSGACLIQRKSGMDLPASVIDRLSASLSRMRATGARPAQCILMFIGTLFCTQDGEGMIDAQEIKGFNQQSFWIVQSSIDKWTERGGVYLNLSRPGLFLDWMKLKEKHLYEFLHEPSHTVYDPTDPLMLPIDNDPLQELVLVKDWRKTLMSIKGIGPTRIEALLVAMQNQGATVNLINCLIWLTEWKYAQEVEGIGKGTVTQVRDWMGLEDDFNISLTI